MDVLTSCFKDGFTECIILSKGKYDTVVKNRAWKDLSLQKQKCVTSACENDHGKLETCFPFLTVQSVHGIYHKIMIC